jgi:hypothetical protein
MKIWVIYHYAGRLGIGTGWRHWELCRRWQDVGCRVRVFAASIEIGCKEVTGSLSSVHPV